jgi:hypothetical protein
MDKNVAKMAAARQLAVRLFWMMRTHIEYPEIVRIESNPRAESCLGSLLGRLRKSLHA